MKNIKYLICISILSFAFNLSAQDCGAIASIKKGTVLEFTNYNKKDKAESKVSHVITAVKSSGNRLESTSDMQVSDMNGNTLLASEAYFTCEDGDYIADLSRMFNGEQLGALTGGDVTFEGKGLRYPKNMKSGDQLDDGYGKMSLGADNLMNVEVKFTDRKIEGTETITTTAGTFECFIIAYNVNTKVMMLNIKASSKEWYSNEIGIVRTEHYNRRGKYTGKNELSKWVK